MELLFDLRTIYSLFDFTNNTANRTENNLFA